MRGRGNRGGLQQSLLAPRNTAVLPAGSSTSNVDVLTHAVDLPERDFYPKVERWGGLDVHRFPSTNNTNDLFLRVIAQRGGVELGSMGLLGKTAKILPQEAGWVRELLQKDSGAIENLRNAASIPVEIHFQRQPGHVDVSLQNKYDDERRVFWQGHVEHDVWNSLIADLQEIEQDGCFSDVLPQRKYRPAPSPLLPTTRSTLASELLRQRR